MEDADHIVRHNPDRSRYEIYVDGRLAGVCEYRETDGRVVFPHTEIAVQHRGHGLGAELVQAALEDVRRRGAAVVPACWYVAQFIDEHPQYRELLAA